MDADERALRILDAFEKAPREAGPMTLSQEYLDAIAWVESLPENQSGSDKTSLCRARRSLVPHAIICPLHQCHDRPVFAKRRRFA